MFYNEHGPAHFHARYGEYEVVIAIETLSILKGHFPPRALGLVMEWAALNQIELKNDWEKVLKQEPLKKIKPLS